MKLSDLSTRKRHDTLWPMLGVVLQDLRGPASTQTVAERLQERLGFPAKEMPMVLSWLTKTAAQHIPEATQTGETVKAYGRYGRRWVWSPRAMAGRVVEPAVDTSDW